jgi:DNA helicase II / ATP-dependent DNA helicase PcrA
VVFEEIKICAKRQALLDSTGHLLVLGGPGCGKTTIALVKAATELSKEQISRSQKILFLSFARATIARVIQEVKRRVPPTQRQQLEIATYHGFEWGLIQSYGYLLTGQRRIRLLPPPEAASRMAGIPAENRTEKLRELLQTEQLLGFDLFAELAADLLERSPRLRSIVSDCYPTIIVDEFQDTNGDEWRLIKALAERSRLIALADPEQRIYEFRGADPARIGEFTDNVHPEVFDFGGENNRSDGTDITSFGNDLLTRANKGKQYRNVKVARYGYYASEPFCPIKFAIFESMRRLIDGGKPDWSLGVLVSSNDFMLKVSNYLASSSKKAQAIPHEVLIDPEGPSLAAILIGGLLEGAPTAEEIEKRLLIDLIEHIRGCDGGEISKANLRLVEALQEYLRTGQIRGKTRLELIANIRDIAIACVALTLTGDPTKDWQQIQGLITGASHHSLKAVGEDGRYLRLLKRGTQLREGLSEQWRLHHKYPGARRIVSDALTQEHFSASTRAWIGVNVMTMHKSKGKEFDEVILFEGYRIGRLLREHASANEERQARITLRVAVTRSRLRTTILTPQGNCCPLL